MLALDAQGRNSTPDQGRTLEARRSARQRRSRASARARWTVNRPFNVEGAAGLQNAGPLCTQHAAPRTLSVSKTPDPCNPGSIWILDEASLGVGRWRPCSVERAWSAAQRGVLSVSLADLVGCVNVHEKHPWTLHCNNLSRTDPRPATPRLASGVPG